MVLSVLQAACMLANVIIRASSIYGVFSIISSVSPATFSCRSSWPVGSQAEPSRKTDSWPHKVSVHQWVKHRPNICQVSGGRLAVDNVLIAAPSVLQYRPVLVDLLNMHDIIIHQL